MKSKVEFFQDFGLCNKKKKSKDKKVSDTQIKQNTVQDSTNRELFGQRLHLVLVCKRLHINSNSDNG